MECQVGYNDMEIVNDDIEKLQQKGSVDEGKPISEVSDSDQILK